MYLGRTNVVPGLYLLRSSSVVTERGTTMVRSIYKGGTNGLHQGNLSAVEGWRLNTLPLPITPLVPSLSTLPAL